MSDTNGVRLAGKKTGWCHWTTPTSVLDVVMQVGPIALDPCSNEHSLVVSPHKFDYEGLTNSWFEKCQNQGLAFVNPPYNNVKAFVKKCVLEGLGGTEIILLVAARMDTKWSHACLDSADAMCFWEGRIKFGNPPPESAGNAPSIPSVFYYWGQNRRLFMNRFMHYGFCVDLRDQRAKRPSFPVSE